MATAVKHRLESQKASKHALAGRGPIVDRARRALQRVAEQFGEVTSTGDTEVHVCTASGIDLTLSYNPGNYVFSRVYNLTVKAHLPESSEVPAGLKLSFARGETKFVTANSAHTSTSKASEVLDRLNARVTSKLNSIDLHSGSVKTASASKKGERKSVTIVPLGGSFVWVLIPPVFHATAFPQGEPERIISLIETLATWKFDPGSQ